MKKAIFINLTSYQFYVSGYYAKLIREIDRSSDIYFVNVGISGCSNYADNSWYTYNVPELDGSVWKRVWKRLYWAGNLFGICPLGRIKFDSNCLLFCYNNNEPITYRFINMVKKKRGFVTIVEEGIGTYEETSGFSKNYKMKAHFAITSVLGAPMQYSAIGENNDIDAAIIEKVNLYSKLPKSKNQILIKQNKKMIFSYTFGNLDNLFNQPDLMMNADYLYLGQAFGYEEEGLTKGEVTILSYVLKKVEGNIIIKQHPREKADKYNELTIKNNHVYVLPDEFGKLPMEALAGRLNVKCFISVISSAAVNLANMFDDVTVILLYKVVEFGGIIGELIGDNYSYPDDLFQGNRRNVFRPESLVEFESVLEQIKPQCISFNNVVKKREKDNEIKELYNHLERWEKVNAKQ